MVQADSVKFERPEKSPEHRCIDELLTFAVVAAVEYKRNFCLKHLHQVHANIIDRACRLIGREIISPIFDDNHPQRWACDRSDEPKSEDSA